LLPGPATIPLNPSTKQPPPKKFDRKASIMAPSATEPVSQTASDRILVKPWSRPLPTKEDLDWAPLVKIDLSRFDEPGGKQELAKQLYDAVTRVGFWVVVNTGIDDERVLKQFSIGNTFFKEPLEEKRTVPCNFEKGEYFGYRENSRWIGDTGVKENIEMVRLLRFPSLESC
jgi:gibberellin 2-oxidase